ncbi:MAG: hypothetical protein DMG80_01420 [Acidobacteria bacterium]|nr:MAG: hypothetical protein DMG80_01420 [Acidobacteriota bacterium]
MPKHAVGKADETIDRKMTRREMVEKLLAGIATGAAWPLIATAHPVYRHLKNSALLDRSEAAHNATRWVPLFLNQQQNESLIALSESMVPGSIQAKVNRFIDLLLSVDTKENQGKFVASLRTFNKIAEEQFGQAFPRLPLSDRDIVLKTASTQADHHRDFSNLKDWITTAYYSSEEGMQELGWTKSRAFRAFPGCDHESH